MPLQYLIEGVASGPNSLKRVSQTSRVLTESQNPPESQVQNGLSQIVHVLQV